MVALCHRELQPQQADSTFHPLLSAKLMLDMFCFLYGLMFKVCLKVLKVFSLGEVQGNQSRKV